MIKTKNKKIKITQKTINAAGLMERWLLCQQIGKIFYNSELSFERLQEIREYFLRSDFLKEEVFDPKLK